MSTVGFSKGDSSATYTSFRGGGILANYNKSMKNLGEMLDINSRQYMSTIINRFEKLSLVKRHNKFLYINYNYVTKCEDRLLRKEVLELFESDEPKKQDKPKGTRIMEGF